MKITMTMFTYKLVNNESDCPEMLNKIPFYSLGRAVWTRELFTTAKGKSNLLASSPV